MFIHRCFGTKRAIWLSPVSSPPRTTTAGVIATISRQRFDRLRSRSLSTTIICTTNARISSVLVGHGARRIQHTTNNDDGLTGFRYFSSRNKNNSKKNKRFNLRALPFSISPEEALESFKKWAEDDQGLRYLMNYNSVRIGAAYVPVWSFDMNIRFKQQQTTGKSSSSLYSWKPPIFEGYDDLGRGGSQSKGSRQDVIYLPGGLSAYAGYSYRRSLINPVHSTTLIFMGDQTEPFGGWMLKDMKLQETGMPIHVIPDAWNSTQGRAFSMVKEELQGIVDGDWAKSDLNNNGDTPSPIAQTQVVSARRVFMPTFVIDYKIFGLEYQAFVSGCDTSAPVGGVSHQIFEGGDSTTIEGLATEFHRSSRNLLVQLSSGASQLLRTLNLPILLTIFRPIFSILWFTLVRIFAFTPVIGVAGGLFAGFRKVIQPWMDNRKASADWERQRQHEAEMAEDENTNKMNDFNDVSGRARAHFLQNKDFILRSLSGDVRHEEGDFDWYSDWQAWAQQQWQQQERYQQNQQQQNQQQWQQWQGQRQQQNQQQYNQQQQQQQRSQQPKRKQEDEFKWPFNPHDPYSVLGIDRYASDSEVSNAFRKEMLQYHPDTQPNATEAQKRRSVERAKLITEAYRNIKTERKGKRQR